VLPWLKSAVMVVSGAKSALDGGGLCQKANLIALSGTSSSNGRCFLPPKADRTAVRGSIKGTNGCDWSQKRIGRWRMSSIAHQTAESGLKGSSYVGGGFQTLRQSAGCRGSGRTYHTERRFQCYLLFPKKQKWQRLWFSPETSIMICRTIWQI
jgi:hypothetical protein